MQQQYKELKHQQPQLRPRNAAAVLQVSEAELLACRGDVNAVRLSEDWSGILSDVAELGDVMALTRNQYCVHERHGVYHNLSFFGSENDEEGKGPTMGMALNPDIDLRLFLSRWCFGFAVTEPLEFGERHSLQFFDPQGVALHKIYLTAASDLAAYHRLVSRHRSEKPLWPDVLPAKQQAPSKAPTVVDISALEQDWRALTDVHQFFPMLRKHKVERLTALQLMPVDLANQVPLGTVQVALQQAACKGCDIMVFVSNHGCVQIHTGAVNNLRQVGQWFNVLDERFNLHLDASGIDQCWVTRKPSKDGVITAIEAYDANGELVVQLFGRRQQGEPELALWRDIVVACECALSPEGDFSCAS
ncbi:hemin-degrading factor [bacterium SCSIO 12696]|nr:hemin-degrading factor [bacterium SCSIO 12696]